jgi:hypothetical protein
MLLRMRRLVDWKLDARDNRHVRAAPGTVQSDIAAVGLPEGPGLVFKNAIGTWS